MTSDPSNYDFLIILFTGLFMKDFISFIGAIRGTGQSYLPEEISIEAIRLADELEKLAGRNP